jgi:hypothetical protein
MKRTKKNSCSITSMNTNTVKLSKSWFKKSKILSRSSQKRIKSLLTSSTNSMKGCLRFWIRQTRDKNMFRQKKLKQSSTQVSMLSLLSLSSLKSSFTPSNSSLKWENCLLVSTWWIWTLSSSESQTWWGAKFQATKRKFFRFTKISKNFKKKAKSK